MSYPGFPSVELFQSFNQRYSALQSSVALLSDQKPEKVTGTLTEDSMKEVWVARVTSEMGVGKHGTLVGLSP